MRRHSHIMVRKGVQRTGGPGGGARKCGVKRGGSAVGGRKGESGGLP